MKRIRNIIRFFRPKIKNILFGLNYLIRGNKISLNSVISKGVLLNNCSIGDYSYVGAYCIFNAVHIGKYSSIAPYVMIGGAEHSYWWYSTSHFISKYNIGGRLTVIGNDVWIGTHAIIKQGVKIGDGAIIGAGSLVLNDVEPYSIVFGVPAKKQKSRFTDEVITQIQGSNFWNYSPRKAKNILNKLNLLDGTRNNRL